MNVAAGRWTIVETVCGGPDRGVFRASGEPRALVAMGPPQQRPHAELRGRFGYACEGIAPLLAIETVTMEDVAYDALFEAEPAGKPITTLRVADPRRVARELAEIVARAHALGYVLGGIRPELVYADEARCTGVAPRTEPFIAGARERSYGVPPCFDTVYASPETLSLEPATRASDVFSLSATIAFLVDGRAPFEGSTLIERMRAALRGTTRALATEPTLRSGLAVNPAQRPDAETIAAALRG